MQTITNDRDFRIGYEIMGMMREAVAKDGDAEQRKTRLMALKRNLRRYSHEEKVSKILADYFGEAIADYDLDKLRAFIAASFEIRSANTTLTKIVDDAEYIQRRSYFEAKGVLR